MWHKSCRSQSIFLKNVALHCSELRSTLTHENSQVEKGDSIAALAAKFQTTVKQIISLNPDVMPGAGADADSYLNEWMQEGQDLCIVPCAVLPRLPLEDPVSVQ